MHRPSLIPSARSTNSSRGSTRLRAKPETPSAFNNDIANIRHSPGNCDERDYKSQPESLNRDAGIMNDLERHIRFLQLWRRSSLATSLRSCTARFHPSLCMPLTRWEAWPEGRVSASPTRNVEEYVCFDEIFGKRHRRLPLMSALARRVEEVERREHWHDLYLKRETPKHVALS